ncbi:MAG: DUF362 domain-containing protein [Oscillospiraceae bacterium]|nr:DUF362 domain-containing protein [Oscillospiraceae bacterium]
MSKVSVTKASAYDPAALDAAIDAHMSAFDMQSRIKPGMKIALKPNLLIKAHPDKAVTTHPQIVAAVLRWLRNHGAADIVIAESPGGPHTKAHLEGVFRACGILDIAREYGAVPGFDTSNRNIPCPDGLICRGFTVINPAAEADIIINLPKLKTHGMTMLSGAVKNMMGVIPGLQKPEMHFRFQDKAAFGRMLVDLSLCVPPVISIVDAVVSMEGNGPSGGNPRGAGHIFAAENPHALDLALCAFINMPPEFVPTVKDAVERGLCPENAAAVEYLCDGRPSPITDYKFPDSMMPVGFYAQMPRFMQRPAKFISERFFTPVPVIRPKDCIGCEKCAESCSPGAIDMHDRKAAIKYEKCIKCFCCHEMCPAKAIDIKRSKLLRW